MWIFTTDGFFSLVKKVDQDNVTHPYQLRARRRDELSNLLTRSGFLADKKLFSYDYADYAYRVFLDETEAQQLGAFLLASVDYSNFKNQFERQPKWYEFKRILGQIWGLLYDYQESGEQGSRKRYHDWATPPKTLVKRHQPLKK